jgi:hypothetical protein
MHRRRETLCSIFIGGVENNNTYEDGTGCSETSTRKTQTPGITKKK